MTKEKLPMLLVLVLLSPIALLLILIVLGFILCILPFAVLGYFIYMFFSTINDIHRRNKNFKLRKNVTKYNTLSH